MTLVLHPFKIDVTPPLGGYLCGGLHDTSLSIETPLYLRGIVFVSPRGRHVVAAIDFCYVCGRSYRRLVEALADGAGAPASNVTVHANHLHDAPLIDEVPHRLIEEHCPELRFHDEAYFARVLADARAGVATAMRRTGQEVSGISFAGKAVERFAGTRRVLDEHHQCKVRYSICCDPTIRDQPEGLIDPMLDQVVFFDEGGKPAVSLSFYASHPQVSDGRRAVSSDTIGVALDLFEKTNPGVFPVYFTGCGGDVTAGKYTTTNKHHNRLAFGLRLFEGMQGAFDIARPQPLPPLRWCDATDDAPLRPRRESEAELVHVIRTHTYRPSRYLAAMKLARLRDGLAAYPFRMTRLSFGDIGILFLPAEMCVPYQFYAKAVWRGRLAVAAYGDCFLKYVATDEAFGQGGYEVEPDWTEVQPGIEGWVKARMAVVLEAGA